MKKVVQVKFYNNAVKTRYAYYTTEDVKDGDLVIVPTSSQSEQFGFAIAQVAQTEGISPMNIMRASKWIVCKLNLDEYKARVRKEQIAQELINQLDEMAKQQNRYAIFQTMAQTNPKVQELFAQLAEVDDTAKALLEGSKPTTENS